MKLFLPCAVVAILVLTPAGAHKPRSSPRRVSPLLQGYNTLKQAYLDFKEDVVLCENMFMCSVHQRTPTSTSVECIPDAQRCDGIPQCQNTADEMGCTPPTTPEPPPFACPPGQYSCQLEDKCIHASMVCDESPDCVGHDDENDCPATCFCDVGSFVCADHTCIPQSQYCDGIPHCEGGDDEPDQCGCTMGENGEPSGCLITGVPNDLNMKIAVAYTDDTNECKERCRRDPTCLSIIMGGQNNPCVLFPTDDTDDFASNIGPDAICNRPFYKKHCP